MMILYIALYFVIYSFSVFGVLAVLLFTFNSFNHLAHITAIYKLGHQAQLLPFTVHKAIQVTNNIWVV